MARTGRTGVTLRDAGPDDVAFLAELWWEPMRRGDAVDREHDVRVVLERVAGSPDQRVVVAEQSGERAGAVLLRLATLSPVNLEPVVQVLVPTVLPRLRRRGVGRALMEAAVAFAEESGTGHVATAAEAGSREANRFMARLGFSQQATYRTASTALVRSRVGGHRADPATGARPVGRILAARRSLRRAQESRPVDGAVPGEPVGEPVPGRGPGFGPTA